MILALVLIFFALICLVYLAKALFFTLAMQGQAHKCRNKNVFLNIAVETCACACIVITPRKQKAA